MGNKVMGTEVTGAEVTETKILGTELPPHLGTASVVMEQHKGLVALLWGLGFWDGDITQISEGQFSCHLQNIPIDATGAMGTCWRGQVCLGCQAWQQFGFVHEREMAGRGFQEELD